MRIQNLLAAVVFVGILFSPCMADKAQTTTATVDDSPPATCPSTHEPDKKDDDSDGALQGEVEKASITEHEVTIDGEILKYRATAANMPMKDEHGKLKASVFFFA